MDQEVAEAEQAPQEAGSRLGGEAARAAHRHLARRCGRA